MITLLLQAYLFFFCKPFSFLPCLQHIFFYLQFLALFSFCKNFRVEVKNKKLDNSYGEVAWTDQVFLTLSSHRVILDSDYDVTINGSAVQPPILVQPYLFIDRTTHHILVSTNIGKYKFCDLFCSAGITRRLQVVRGGFDSRLEPSVFDIFTGWLLTRRAQPHFAISLNYWSNKYLKITSAQLPQTLRFFLLFAVDRCSVEVERRSAPPSGECTGYLQATNLWIMWKFQ